jgi:vitamin B12 transporter
MPVPEVFMLIPPRARRACPLRTAALLLTLSAPALGAQQLDSTRLEELVVTATRAPAPIHPTGSATEVFRAAELRRRQLASLREALQLAPGSGVLANGAAGAVGSVFLRGVSSSQTLLLVDGIRLNDANTSSAGFLGAADLAGLGRLEIVRGPQSTLFGGAAIGGVIALDAAPAEPGTGGSLELEGGSFESWRGRLVAGARRGRLGVATAFTINGTENQRRPNDWEQRTQLIRIDARPGGGLEVGATFRGLQHRFTSPGDLRTSNTTPAGTTTFDHHLATVWLQATPAERWRTRLTLGGQEQFTGGTGRFNGDEFSFTLQNSRRVIDWQNSVVLGSRAALVAGLNREWSTATSDGEPLDERLLGAYLEIASTPVPAVALTAGIRHDRYNTFENASTWRVTAAWRPGERGTRLRASLGTGFMPPGLSARFGSVFQEPNPEIRPERSRGFDAGVDQELAGGKAGLGLTWFHNSLRDLIGFESAPFPARGRSINVDRARTRGLEASARVTAGPVDARLAWALLDAETLSESDPTLRRLIRRPRHTMHADFALTLSATALAGAGLLVVADREDTDFNAFPAVRIDPGDYALMRLYGAMELRTGVSLRGRVDNLFNTRYEPVYGFPGLGRAGTVSVELRF